MSATGVPSTPAEMRLKIAAVAATRTALHSAESPAFVLLDKHATCDGSGNAAPAPALESTSPESAVGDISTAGRDVADGHGDSSLKADDCTLTRLGQALDRDFVRWKNGSILAGDLDNIRLALRQLQVMPRFDAFLRQVLVAGKPLDDGAVDELWVRINDTFQFRPPKDTLRTLLSVDAHRNAFHPVRDYLDALQWDGVPRLNDWLIAYGGAEPSAYVCAVSRLPLIAAVRRVRHPGAKFDELLVLESAQGKLKSTALRTLCPNDAWFSDDLPLGVDSKQVIERTTGKWLIEAMEMYGHRGREAEQVKAFLSRQVDGPVRLAFERLPTTVPRQFVLIGTINSRAYLKDSTGGRRFWPVAVSGFDIDALSRDRDQLWAEAAVREKAGEPIRLARELWAAAGATQEQRRVADPWEEVLERVLEDPCTVVIETIEHDVVPVSKLWDTLGVEADKRNNQHADRIAAIVEKYGFTKEKLRLAVGENPTWCWIRDPSCSERCPEQS